MIYIDKVKLQGLRITDVKDVQSLLQRKLIKQKSDLDDDYKIKTESGEKIHSITIPKDGIIDLLKFFPQCRNGEYYYCSILELSVPKNDYGNLYGWTMEELHNYVREIVGPHLLTEYGIVVDFSQLVFSYIEINTTFSTIDKFDAYKRPIQLLFQESDIRKRLSDGTVFIKNKKGSISQTGEYFHTPSGNIELVIYDKSLDLKERHRVADPILDSLGNVMRIELKLKSRKTIKSKLSTNRFFNLTHEDIERCFANYVQKGFFSRIEKYEKRVKSDLAKMIQKCKTEEMHWVKSFLNKIANDRSHIFVLDICQVEEAFKELQLPRDTKSKALKELRRLCEFNALDFCKGDMDRLKEIINSVNISFSGPFR